MRPGTSPIRSHVLSDAGWPSQFVQIDSLAGEGLYLDARYTTATWQSHQSPTNPSPDRTIRQAFEMIRLTFDGSQGSGSGHGVQADAVTITVGRRRRDYHAQWMPVQKLP